MPASGPAALPPVYSPSTPSNTLLADGHEDDLHENDRLELRELWKKLGLTPAASDAPGYVLLGDAGGTGKSLWVPAGAVAGASAYLNENSNYSLWQEVESGSQTCTTTFNARTSFGPDRLFTLPAGASVTVARSTTVPDSKSLFSCAITGAASVTTVDHGVRIRSVYRTRYKTSLLFAAYVRNESGSAFQPTLRVDTPASADSWGSPTNRLAQTLQSCADSAWTLVYYVFDPSAYTNVDNGLAVYLRVPSGSLVSGDVVRVAQFRVVPGTQLMAYTPPDPDLEKIRSLAYRRKSYTDGVAPGTATSVGMAGASNSGSGATNVLISIPFGAPTWKAPSVSLWDGAGNANQFTKGIPGTHHATANASQIGVNGFWIFNTSTSTDDMFVHYLAAAELT